MNKIKFFVSLTVVILSLIAFNSCRKADPAGIPGAVPDNAYDKSEAAVMMTLSAIAYASEGGTVQMIKDTIEYNLNRTELATKGEWQLVWGPGVNDINSNLVYVVKSTVEEQETYAMAVRGTSTLSIEDILQDVQVFSMVPFKFGQVGDSVAQGAMDGLDYLLETEDQVTGLNLSEFLNRLDHKYGKKMFITGHSQGGALAPMLAYWFITSSGLIDRYDLEIYTFAGPSVGNRSFKENFHNALPDNAGFHMVANSLDAVPFFWARYDSLVTAHIPAHVPLLYRILLDAAKLELKNKNITYVQLGKQIDIGCYTPKDTLGTIHPSDTLDWYNHWVLTEHKGNNYLRLLGAEPL